MTLKASIKKDRAVRSEIFIRFARTLFLLGTQILLLSLIFGNQEVYVGWTKAQAYLVMGIWNLLNYTGWSLFGVNLEYLERKVLEGDFDYVLLKPLSSSWLASFCEFSLYNWISSLAGVSLIVYYFVIEKGMLTIPHIVLGSIGICIGLIFWYAFYLFFASFTLAYPRNGFLAVTKEILGLTKYPANVYGSTLQPFLYTILPIAFITTLPAELIIGRGSIYLLIAGLAVSLLFLSFSKWMWGINLRKYVSSGG